MQLNVAKYLFFLEQYDYTTSYNALVENKDVVIRALKKHLEEGTATYIVNNFIFLASVLLNKENIFAIDDYIDLGIIDIDDLINDEQLLDIIGICLLLYCYIIDESCMLLDSEHPVMKTQSYCKYVLNKYVSNENLLEILINWIDNFEDITNISYDNIYNYFCFFIQKACISSTTINADDINDIEDEITDEDTNEDDTLNEDELDDTLSEDEFDETISEDEDIVEVE